MRRRLDIAASIVVTPELMFLDEPTTGLDPRSRNQVWDIIRALVAGGTTIVLCTQYLEEADQLADGIAVIDHGKVIAEGTPGQLKASVGSGALHVRLLDPDQRPQAEQILSRELGAVHMEPDPAALSVQCADGDRGAEAVAELTRAGRGDRRLLARPAQPRRGVPRPDRPPRGRPGTGGGSSMSTVPATDTAPSPEADQEAVRKAIASTAPAEAGQRAVGRAHLRLARDAQGQARARAAARRDHHAGDVRPDVHLPLRRARSRAPPASTSSTSCPGILVMSVLFTTVYSGIALNTDLTKGVVDRFRSLPIWRPAPLVGSLLGDSVRYVLAGTVIIVLGVILGFRPGAGVPGVLAALGLVVLFAFGLSWVFTTLGLLMRSPNAVMNAGFMAIFPLTFLSNVFVDPETLPAGPGGVRRREPDLDPGHLLARADGGQRGRRRHHDRAGHGSRAHGGVRAADHAAVPNALTLAQRICSGLTSRTLLTAGAAAGRSVRSFSSP